MSGYIIVTGGGHLEDAVLLQLVDSLASGAEARLHLTQCADCAQRYSALENAARVLRASLPDVPAPRIDRQSTQRRPAWAMSMPLAIAASIVVLASVAAAAPPVRRWIVRQLAPAPVIDAAALSAPPSPTSIRRASLIASFTPTDSVLIVRIDRAQSSGSLRLISVSDAKVSGQAEGNTEGEELVMMPTGIRVSNRANSIADYKISVPASIRSIHVTTADKPTAVVLNDGHLDRRIPLR
jgi:hypothetical protein